MDDILFYSPPLYCWSEDQRRGGFTLATRRPLNCVTSAGQQGTNLARPPPSRPNWRPCFSSRACVSCRAALTHWGWQGELLLDWRISPSTLPSYRSSQSCSVQHVGDVHSGLNARTRSALPPERLVASYDGRPFQRPRRSWPGVGGAMVLARALAAPVARYEVGGEWLPRRMKRRGRVIPVW